MTSSLAWFYNFLEGNAVIIEVSLLLLSLASILLYYFDISSSSLLLVRSVNLAATIYFFFACFAPIEGKDYKITDIVPKIIAIGFTLPVLGALYKLLNFPGQAMLPKIGALSMCIAALIGGFKSRRNWSNSLVALAVRISLIITLGLVLWFL